VLVDVDIALYRVAAALVSVWLLSLVVGGVALVAGALTGSRVAAIGIGLVVSIVGFFVNALAPLSDVLEPLRPLSPHYHYIGYDPLSAGLDAGHALVLVVASLVLVAAAAVAFERRDLHA
jgi:ABC-2 type transport system permease protein